MNRLASIIALATLGSALSVSVDAQTKTIPGEMKTVKGTVENIEPSTRTLTIKTGKESKEIDVPEGVKGFSTVKVGDELTLRYYDNVVLIVKKPGEPDVDTRSAETVLTPGVPGRSGTAARQRTVTATITAIDEKAPSITFSDASKRSHTSPVKDKKMLSQVKVGDKVDITWTTAVLVSLEPGK